MAVLTAKPTMPQNSSRDMAKRLRGTRPSPSQLRTVK
jgi:hypothetical protein